MTAPSDKHLDSISGDVSDVVTHHQQPYRWLILLLLWLLYLSFGIVARSPSPLVTPIIHDLQITYSQMGLVLGSWQITYIVFAITAGIIMDRWGIKRSIFFGALVIGLSAVLRASSTGFYSLLFFISLFGIGGPMISIGCPKTIATLFKGKERGAAIGIYSTGPWIGGMISLAATNSVVMPLTGHSWRMTFVWYGVTTFVFAGLWWILAKETDIDTGGDRFNPLRILAELFGIRRVRLILLSGMLSFGMMHGYFAWLPKILESGGMSPTHAGIASALPFVSSIPAVLTIPRYTHSGYSGWIIGLLALLASLSTVWVIIFDWPIIPGLLLFGICGPCLAPMLVLTLMETQELASVYLGSATGVFFCVAEIGGFFGPFVIGYLYDISGSFSTGGVFLFSLGVIIFWLMYQLQIKSN